MSTPSSFHDSAPASDFGDTAASSAASSFGPDTGFAPLDAEDALRVRDPRLVEPGERIERLVTLSREDIARFATMTLDENPLHHDAAAARRAGQADVIASGQHTSGLMSGLVATWFTRSDDGRAREMLCLNFNYACKAPVPADRPVHLRWDVREVEWNETLRGFIAHLTGEARVAGVAAVVARGTVLVKAARGLPGAVAPAPSCLM